jgi:muconolactone delta-isomerase
MRNKDSHYALPLKERMPFFEKRVMLIEQNLHKGRCKVVYFDADLKGSFSVWDFNTNEEAAELILQMPGREYVDIDIKPVMDMDVAVKQMKMYWTICLKE